MEKRGEIELRDDRLVIGRSDEDEGYVILSRRGTLRKRRELLHHLFRTAIDWALTLSPSDIRTDLLETILHHWQRQPLELVKPEDRPPLTPACRLVPAC